MADKYFGFDDIMESTQGIFADGNPGIIQESAMTQFQKAKPSPVQEGVIYEVMCENCGPRKIVVEYPELVAIRQGISPHVAFQNHQVLRGPPTVWGFDQNLQTWFPDVRCSSCRWQFRMMITPAEIESLLRHANGKGWIAPQAIQQLTQLCMMVKQQAGMMR